MGFIDQRVSSFLPFFTFLTTGVLHQPREWHNSVGLALLHGHVWALWGIGSAEAERQLTERLARVPELAGDDIMYRGGCCEDEVVYKVNFEYRVILHTMELKQVFLLLYIHECILSVPCCSCALFLRT